jgi:hypothetical protein
VAKTPERWCTVFAPGDEGYEKFGFHGAEGSWSYGDAPRRARIIERAIREHLKDSLQSDSANVETGAAVNL